MLNNKRNQIEVKITFLVFLVNNVKCIYSLISK